MPGREDEVEDSGENDPAKSADRWLLDAIKPAAPQAGPGGPDHPARFARLFHLALLRGRLSFYPPSRLTFCTVTSRHEGRMSIILPCDWSEWFIRIS
jgi:hypothetical protein